MQSGPTRVQGLSPVSMMRFPHPSTCKAWPGRSTVDAAGSSITAGPSATCAGAEPRALVDRGTVTAELVEISGPRAPFSAPCRAVSARGLSIGRSPASATAEAGQVDVDELDRHARQIEGVRLLVQLVEPLRDSVDLPGVRRRGNGTLTVCSWPEIAHVRRASEDERPFARHALVARNSSVAAASSSAHRAERSTGSTCRAGDLRLHPVAAQIGHQHAPGREVAGHGGRSRARSAARGQRAACIEPPPPNATMSNSRGS